MEYEPSPELKALWNDYKVGYRALGDYAVRMHRAIGAKHGCVSPLGAWLLLALVAPLARGERREAIERALAMPIKDADRIARRLVGQPHPAVGAALGAWSAKTPALDAWIAGLPSEIARGPIPNELDSWVRAATKGMIPRFPLTLSPLTLLVFACALAVEFEWPQPYDTTPASDLGGGPWARQVASALASRTHPRCLVRTEAADLVGVHSRSSNHAMTVVSVIADRDVPHDRVFAAAFEAHGSTNPPSLYDLPLGEGASWTITERTVPTLLPDKRTESGRVVLPAWTSGPSVVDLFADPNLGMVDAAKVLLGDSSENEMHAVQSNVARYDRRGFRAASVTGLRIATMARPKQPKAPGVNRHIELRFGHPYAVIALANAPGPIEHKRGNDGPNGSCAWGNVPIFTAWVTEVMEPEPEDRRRDFGELPLIQRMP